MKPVLKLALAAAVFAFRLSAAGPVYSLASVVNSATNNSGEYAPNGMLTIYGTDLAYRTGAAPAGNGPLPRLLAGVTVSIGGLPAGLFYVSPGQINCIVPSNLVPGPVTLTIVREGLAGPTITLTLKDTAPGFFPLPNGTVIATHLDGSLVDANSPARPDQIVVLYAAGLGRTVPDAEPGQPASRAAPLLNLAQLGVLLGGAPVPADSILYGGIAPGFAGLYQINLRIPATTLEDPEIRVFLGLQGSPSFLKLPVRLQ